MRKIVAATVIALTVSVAAACQPGRVATVPSSTDAPWPACVDAYGTHPEGGNGYTDCVQAGGTTG